MNRSLFIIFATIALDAIGIGLIFPILPLLLQDMTHSTHISIYMGILASLYAAMQFIFSPLLGALSDRWGVDRSCLFHWLGQQLIISF
ncbi:tet(A)_4_AJ517790 [Acinetobacter baumannii]|nr:tet(A)_4_AJ517790 [Acinetobacter baumannii]